MAKNTMPRRWTDTAVMWARIGIDSPLRDRPILGLSPQYLRLAPSRYGTAGKKCECLEDQHRVAVTVEAIPLSDRFIIRGPYPLYPSEG